MKRAELYNYSNGERFFGKTAKEVFIEIEKENVWNEAETKSGIGSSILQTKKIVEQIPKVLNDLNIKSIFDIPCGDFNWFQKIDLTGKQYCGGDIVEKIITYNNSKFKKDNTNFIVFNLLEEIPKYYDLIFCRDCLVHFSFADIEKTISNIKDSGSKYLIATTFPEEESNENIITGGWRPIDLTKEPFNFPKPVMLINENCTEMAGRFSDKSLGVWEIKTLR